MADEPTPTNCNWALAVEASPAIAVSTTTAKNAFVPLISIFSLELGLVIFPAFWSLACRSDPPWRPVEFAAVSERLQKRQRSEALLTPPELRGGVRASVVRVRENYHSGLLIGNDRKMNGALNSEAANRKTLRPVDFSAAWSAAPAQCDSRHYVPRSRGRSICETVNHQGHEGTRRRTACGCVECCRVKFLRSLSWRFWELVHYLNQALHDGGESGALELRVNRR